MFSLLLLVVALVFFIIGAFNTQIKWIALGLASWVLSQILPLLF
jgi:hypothetical protein